MKKENLEEAKMLVNRIENFENAIEVCENPNYIKRGLSKLYLNLFKPIKRGFIEVCYEHDSYINLSDEQSQELLNIIKKWLKDDKEKLDAL